MEIPETEVLGGHTLTLRLKVEMEHEDGFGLGANSSSWIGLLACSRVRFALPTLENEFERCSSMAQTTRPLLFDLWQHLGILSPRPGIPFATGHDPPAWSLRLGPALNIIITTLNIFACVKERI
jgi:hypothetical protein